MGVLFFTFACFTYLRYFSDPANMHVQERLQHAHILGPLWSASLFGSVLFGVASLFGLGWSRWTGVLANGSAFVCALMSLGAACGPDKVIELWERGAEQQIAQVHEREARELSRLDKLIAAAREFAHEVKDRTVAFAKDIKERAGSLFGNAPQEEQTKGAPEKDQAQEQARPPTPEMQARLDELLGGFNRRMEAQQSVEAKLADFGSRMDTRLQQEQAQALARQQQEQALKQQQEQTKTKEPEIEREHSRGFGIGR
jgi:hypothetical protein